MQDEILALIKSLNLNLFLNAFVVFLLTNLIKPIIPKSLKKKICLLPFIIGILLSFVYSYFIKKEQNLMFVLENGIGLGGLATLIYAIIKQMLKGDNLQKNISTILEGIMSSSTLKNVSQSIVKNYSQSKSNEENLQTVSQLIAENTSISESECKAVSGIILKILAKK